MRTTTLDIFVDILQRLRSIKAEIEITTTMEMDEAFVEDDEGNEVFVEAEPGEVSFIVEETIAIDEQQRLLVDDAIIEDVEDDALFDAHVSSDTDIEMFCTLLNELVDAGYGVQTKVGEEDMRILDIEHLDDQEGLTAIGKFLSRGRFKILYVAFESENGAIGKEAYEVAEHIPSYQNFLIWYNKEEAHYRIYPRNWEEAQVENALEYYKTSFVPMIQAARRNGEIPSLLFH